MTITPIDLDEVAPAVRAALAGHDLPRMAADDIVGKVNDALLNRPTQRTPIQVYIEPGMFTVEDTRIRHGERVVFEIAHASPTDPNIEFVPVDSVEDVDSGFSPPRQRADPLVNAVVDALVDRGCDSGLARAHVETSDEIWELLDSLEADLAPS